ncbi:MAG: hypothetical protein RL297_2051 [Pseudomonadota bacterium]|jgi:hypothetical protein
MKALPLIVLGGLTASAWAHEGHGLWGAHWHASDTLGFLAVVVGLAVWFSRK